MADPQILYQLRAKRDQIERAIKAYTEEIKRAEIDLAHVNATLRMFESGDVPDHAGVAYGLHRVFKRGEMTKIAKWVLEREGPLDTRELARWIIRAKGLNEDDKPLRKAVAHRLVHALYKQALRRAGVRDCGKRNGVKVWALTPAPIQKGS